MIPNPSQNCSYVVFNFWANLSLIEHSYKIVLIKFLKKRVITFTGQFIGIRLISGKVRN